MQTKSLSMRRALSTALFVLLLSVAGMKNALAQNQVATLQHDGTITGTYYGENALTSAYNAASSGDIITLSSGTFSCPTISKRITIHGASCEFDSVTNVMKTQISNNFVLYNSSNTSFEGIHFSGTINCYGSGNSSHSNSFVKCAIYNIIQLGSSGTNINYNLNFVNCIIKNFATKTSSIYCMLGLSFINSVVRFISYDHSNIQYPNTIYNSVVLFDNGQNIKNIIAYNSIIASASGHTVTNCTFFNCIGIETGETSLFDGQTCSNVMEVDGYDDVFKTFDGTVTFDNIYQLKNDIATSFLGHDGTEVGIYGGITPYKTRPSYMILKNCNVAGQTDENKKLNVEMELIGPED